VTVDVVIDLIQFVWIAALTWIGATTTRRIYQAFAIHEETLGGKVQDEQEKP